MHWACGSRCSCIQCMHMIHRNTGTQSCPCAVVTLWFTPTDRGSKPLSHGFIKAMHCTCRSPQQLPLPPQLSTVSTSKATDSTCATTMTRHAVIHHYEHPVLMPQGKAPLVSHRYHSTLYGDRAQQQLNCTPRDQAQTAVISCKPGCDHCRQAPLIYHRSFTALSTKGLR